MQDTTYLSIAQVSTILDISKRKAGEIMNEMNCLVLPGGRKRVSCAEFEKWVNHHTVSCKPETGRLKPKKTNLQKDYKIRRRTA